MPRVADTSQLTFRAFSDPITSRWLSNDPIGISGGLNQYVFCANNPVNFVDPLGLCESKSWKLTVNVESGGATSPGSSYVNYKKAYGHGWVVLTAPSGGERAYGSFPLTFGHEAAHRNRPTAASQSFDISSSDAHSFFLFVMQYERGYIPGVTWNAASENCIDFVYKAASSANVDLPGTDWGINTPNHLIDLLNSGGCR